MKTLSLACILSLLLTSQAAFAKSSKRSTAEKYAAALAAVLTDYQKQVEAKIAAEELAYIKAAKLYDSSFRTNITATLTEDRTSDSLRDLASLQSGDLTADQLIAEVNTYAQSDFDQTRSLYEMDVDSYKTYLANLNSLDVDSEKITSLLEALNALATPETFATRLSEIQNYQKGFTQQLHLSDCSIANSLLTVRVGQMTAIDAQIAALPANSSSLQALQDQSAGLATQIASLLVQRMNSGGYTPDPNGATGTCQAK